MAISGIEQRAVLYAKSRLCAIGKSLGTGTDGAVWATSRKTAVKAFESRKNFVAELECYQRLRDQEITSLCGFSVPQLVDFEEEQLVIEMSIVKPPFILDFGKVYLDRPPDFSPEVMEEWRATQQDLWGEYWPTIRSILGHLRALGIHHMDPKPGNIMPENWNPKL